MNGWNPKVTEAVWKMSFIFKKKPCVSGSILIFWGGTPLKINREHNHGGLSLEDHFPFQMGDL